VRDNGLKLETHSFGNYHFEPHAVFSSIEAAAKSGTEFDYVVVTTKALPDVTDDSKTIEGVVSGKTSVVLIQNGVGVEEPHRKRFKDAPVLSAVTVVSAAQTEPGVIKQNRWTRISIGPYLGEGASEGLAEKSARSNKRFVEQLQEGGIKDAEEYDEKGLQLVRWHKLAVGLTSPVSAELCTDRFERLDQCKHESKLRSIRRYWQFSNVARPRAATTSRRLHARDL
jgi:2-dehydropantoate 2-reductase